MGKGSGVCADRPSLTLASTPTQSVKTIRLATIDDIDELVTLKRIVAGETYRQYCSPAVVAEWLDHNANDAHYRYRVGRSGYTVLTSKDEHGEIVAVGTMRIRGKRADMSGLYVKDKGQGIGTAVCLERERLARSLGCTRVRVSVFRCNTPAQGFVLSRGFVKTGGGFRDPITGVRVDHYERDL